MLDLRLPALFLCLMIDPYYRLSGGQLHLLDEVQIASGGKFGQGYAYGHKVINPRDWFFKAHFHQDPVMPGSLGVEAMLQALQAYALQSGLGREFRSPRFAHALDHNTVWKYRGPDRARQSRHVAGIAHRQNRDPARTHHFACRGESVEGKPADL